MTDNYYKTKESVQEYISLAKDVNGGQLIKELMKYLPNNSSVLEIGTGPGTDWNILKDNYTVIASDNSSEFLKHLQKTYPSGEFIALDAISLVTNLKFDGIYSNKVMHHLQKSELEESIKRQYDIIGNDGIICHSFWKGTESEVFKGLFVQYHTKTSIEEHFKGYFETLLIQEYAEFEEGDSILFIGKKKASPL